MAGKPDSAPALRVALLAGTLGQGGAEKQLVYMARALCESNATVRVYTLGQDEFYEAALRRLRVPPLCIGRHQSPLLRLGEFVAALRTYRPHVIHSLHFFGNLYAALAARLFGAVSIGSIRGDAFYDVETNAKWAPWLLRLPAAIIANSQAAVDNLKAMGGPGGACHIVPNVIDLAEFDTHACNSESVVPSREAPVVITVSTLARVKRLDRFLDALAVARETLPGLRGMIIGDGPEESRLEALARERGLLPHGVHFLGRRQDVPSLLSRADAFLFTSEHEGFPNVLLEAMAARLPIVTTPAGDAGRVVQDGVTGYVVPFDDVPGMAERLLRLVKSPALRQRLGDAGRRSAEQSYGFRGLGGRLLATYRVIAERQKNSRAVHACLSCALPDHHFACRA